MKITLEEILTNKKVIDDIKQNLDWSFNDDMINGNTLACIFKDRHGNKVQMQIKLTGAKGNFLEDYKNECPEFLIDRELNISTI